MAIPMKDRDKRERHKQLLKIIQKVRTFNGLAISELEKLLKVSTFRIYEEGQEIFKIDDPSQEILILLEGKLIAQTSSGTLLGEILPGTSTGEMGVFTGKGRSATVTAVAKSSCLVIRKGDFNDLLWEDPSIEGKVLRSIVVILAERLTEADRQIESYSTDRGGQATPEPVEVTESEDSGRVGSVTP